MPHSFIPADVLHLNKEDELPHPDIIKRFAKTPIEAMLALSGTSIRLETNCQAVADHLRRALTSCAGSAAVAPDFVLRVVAESEADLELDAAPTVCRLSRDGLSFISLGRTSFLALDRQAGRGISFIPESLVADEKRFSQLFLPALLSLLKESIDPSS